MALLGVLPYTTNRYGKRFRHFVFTDADVTWVEVSDGPGQRSLADQVAEVESRWPDLGPGTRRVIPLGDIRRSTFQTGPAYPRLSFFGARSWEILADCTFMLDWRHRDEEKAAYARSLVPRAMPTWVALEGF